MPPPAPPSPDIHLNESALVPFTGDDRSDELEATSKLSLVNGALQLKNGDNPPANLNPIASNEFQAEDRATIKFHEVGKGHVAGLTLFSQAVRGITFPESGLIHNSGAISVRGPSEVPQSADHPAAVCQNARHRKETVASLRSGHNLAVHTTRSASFVRLRLSCKYDAHRVP